ncbi:alpha/beta hydrolase [bacterium]|nr:alpha/beta hydrolase [bacterium]
MGRHFILVFMLFSQILNADQASPPAQPAKGPGGKDYSHSAVIKNRYEQGIKEYWIYEPDQPKPSSAPLIVFLHGWGAMNPATYGAWIDHLVKRGNIVIYPRYQADLKTPLKDFTANVIDAIHNAINRLQTEPNHVSPDLSRLAVVGHSVGGLLTANVTALAYENGLPQVAAMMSVEPGRTWNPGTCGNVPLADLSKIPAKTLLLSVAGDKDRIARDTDAKRIYYESKNVNADSKDFVTMVSDDHGTPPLIAHHGAPSAFDVSYDNDEKSEQNTILRERLKEKMRERQNGNDETEISPEHLVNALDFYGTWKLFDGLCDAAFYGKNREYALGNTTQQRNMGVWSDGVQVKQLAVTDQP